MRSWTLLWVAVVLVSATPVVAEMADIGQSDGTAGPMVEASSESEVVVGAESEDVTGAEAPDVVGSGEADVVESESLGSDIADVDSAQIPPPVEPTETVADEISDADQAMGASEDMQRVELVDPVNDPVSGLGPLAVDAKGQKGRIHTVIPGDTLWDISTAYLGTPWVWPSVWKDNGEIANPHVINPGDRIWITAGEMRIVSDEEADAMIAAEQQASEVVEAPEPEWEVDPAAPADEEDLMADEMPAAMDNLPVAVPAPATAAEKTGRTIYVSERDAMGFVSTEAVDAATSIVDSPSPRTWLVDGDLFYLGQGEGAVAVDDEFTIFRDTEGVVDTETGRLLGYHVEILGWAVVRKVNAETATAEIRMSRSEIRRGDQLTPRVVQSTTVPVRITPDGIEGKIVFMPDSRTSMGDSDYVYLNRGSLHGFEVGSEVEVYTPGELEADHVRRAEVMTPDYVAAHMVLVEVQPDSSVAYIVNASRELEIGDMVRPATRKIASR